MKKTFKMKQKAFFIIFEGLIKQITQFFLEGESLTANSGSVFPKKLCYLIHGKPFKNDKNAFYLILKALFVLKIFEFLSWLFGHIEKTA